MRRTCTLILCALTCAASAWAGQLEYKQHFSRLLIAGVPGLLANFDAKTGHFGQGVWICRDQDAMYPLAVAYTLDVPGNPYRKDPQLLQTIMAAGDALAADADPEGRWVFRKKDGSTWGMIYMPWTYSRWVRTFTLIRDDMPSDRRAAWEKALIHGYTGISKTQLGHQANIPTHHAMGLYIAGEAFNRPEWREQAAEYLHKMVAAQSENGYWTEGEGPVVAYNFVYVDAIGTYYALSKDATVRPALERASAFHRNFTYPDGNSVETIDQRNPFHASVNEGNLGFTFDPVGRAYLASQWKRYEDKEHKLDLMASFILYGQEGETQPSEAQAARTYVLREAGVEQAMTIRQGPWFICLSAITTPLSGSRWIQDRQNLLSIYHDQVGLIVGGGNTKLQPGWSNFTVGDPSLLQHKPADTNPSFQPAGELYHVPSKAVLVREPSPGLDLTYGPQTCRIRVVIRDERMLICTLSAEPGGKLPVIGRVTLLPRMGQDLSTAAGQHFTLADQGVDLSSEQVGGAIQYAGCRLALPAVAGLHWPALAHNPYVKDGHSGPEQGRIEIRIPFDAREKEHRITLTIPGR